MGWTLSLRVPLFINRKQVLEEEETHIIKHSMLGSNAHCTSFKVTLNRVHTV